MNILLVFILQVFKLIKEVTATALLLAILPVHYSTQLVSVRVQ